MNSTSRQSLALDPVVAQMTKLLLPLLFLATSAVGLLPQQDPRVEAYQKNLADFRAAADTWDCNKAMKAFQSVEAIAPPAADDYVKMAHILRASEQPDAGVTLIQRGFRQYPSVATAIELVACQREAGQINDARKTLRMVLRQEITPDQLKAVSYESWTLSSKKWRFDFKLTPDPINLPKGKIQDRGYYEFYTRPDYAFQQVQVTVVDAARSESATDSAGNKILRLWPKSWDEPVKVSMTVTQEPIAFHLAKEAVPPESMPKEVRAYLGQSPEIDPSGPTAVRLAAKLKGSNRAETVENVRRWAMAAIKYDDTVKPGEVNRRDSETVLIRRRGYCFEISKAVTAILRACQIPARRVMMLNLFPAHDTDLEFSGALTGGHAEAEFWDPKCGWIPIQARPASVCAPGCILLASEVVDEGWWPGTLDYLSAWSYYGGGNGKDPLVNVESTLLSCTLN